MSSSQPDPEQGDEPPSLESSSPCIDALVSSGCSFPEIVDWAQPRGRKTSLQMHIVATHPTTAECLTALISHYPFIVYLGFLLWRKNMVLLELILDDGPRKSSQPPLFLPNSYERLRGEKTSFESEDDVSIVTRAGNFGFTGNLRAFSNEGENMIPGCFLQERRPLTLDTLPKYEISGQDEENATEEAELPSAQNLVGNFLSWAARNNQVDVLITMSLSLQLNQMDRWPVRGGLGGPLLCRAAMRGLVPVVAQLFRFHHQEAFAQKDLDSSLYWSLESNYYDVANLLAHNKANVDSAEVGEPALICAARKPCQKALDFLLVEHRGSPNVADSKGRTGLHWAAFNNRIEVIRFLLEHGADPNARDEKQMVPLHFAAQQNKVEAINILVEEGKADFMLRSLLGSKPWDLASRHKAVEAAELLLAFERKQ